MSTVSLRYVRDLLRLTQVRTATCADLQGWCPMQRQVCSSGDLQGEAKCSVTPVHHMSPTCSIGDYLDHNSVIELVVYGMYSPLRSVAPSRYTSCAANKLDVQHHQPSHIIGTHDYASQCCIHASLHAFQIRMARCIQPGSLHTGCPSVTAVTVCESTPTRDGHGYQTRC